MEKILSNKWVRAVVAVVVLLYIVNFWINQYETDQRIQQSLAPRDYGGLKLKSGTVLPTATNTDN